MQKNMRAGFDLKDESWRIKKCKFCGCEIVWVKSKKTGKSYPVNFGGLIDVFINDFHECRKYPNVYKFMAEYKVVNRGTEWVGFRPDKKMVLLGRTTNTDAVERYLKDNQDSSIWEDQID